MKARTDRMTIAMKADQNLVMIRVGTASGNRDSRSGSGLGSRLTPEGTLGDAAYYKRGERVVRPGKRFGD